MPTKMSYLNSLSSYVPGLSLMGPDAPKPGDDAYDDVSVLRLECCLERLRSFAMAVEKSKLFPAGGKEMVDVNINARGNDYRWIRDPFNAAETLGNWDSFLPNITPREVSCLYHVYETEKVPIRSGKRTTDGRNFHIVHKRYRPEKVDAIFRLKDPSYPEESDETTGIIYTVLEDKNHLQEDLDLVHVPYEQYRREAYSSPTEDPAPVRPSVTEKMNIANYNFYLQSIEDPLLREYRTNYFFVKDYKIKDKRNIEYSLKPVRVDCYRNARAWTFPSASDGTLPARANDIVENLNINESNHVTYPKVRISKSVFDTSATSFGRGRQFYDFLEEIY